MYITEDVGDIYVDLISTNEEAGIPGERIRLNSESAEKIRKITYNEDGSYKSEESFSFDDISTIINAIQENLNSLSDNKMDKLNPVGEGSFSMGRAADTTIGNNSFVIGTNNTASAENSVATGKNNIVTGQNSVVLGYSNEAQGPNCVAIGNGTIAYGQLQVAQGRFNIANSTFAHIVGNGTSNTSRSNIYTLDWDGNAWFAGDVYVGSTSGTNKDTGSKKLATEEYVDNSGGAFYVTYGEDIYATIKTAYENGKIILCARNSRIYRLYSIPTGDNTLFFMAEYDNDDSMDQVYYIKLNTSNEWSEEIGSKENFSVKKSYNGQTDISSSIGYYRPIRVSTSAPTAADGNVGDIWIQYS